MHLSRPIALFALFFLLSCSAPTSSTAPSPDVSVPSIEGTYKLVSRTMADGKTITPPQIEGLFTYTKTHRNFNLVGEDAMGKFSGSLGATYTLTANEYTQTQIFYTGNDSADRKKIVYEGAKETQKAPVKMDNGRIEFKLPDPEPTLVFEGSKMTATAPGEFVDVWEKLP
jgi:hypothetical protein